MNYGTGDSTTEYLREDLDRAPRLLSIQAVRQRRQALNNHFLRSVVDAKPDDTTKWLSDLSGTCLQSSLREKQERKKSFQHELTLRRAAADFLDRITDIISGYCLELNLSAAPPDQICCTRPALVTESVKLNNCAPVEKRTFYRSRFSSRKWSLVLRSNHNQLEFFLMPAARVLGLSSNEESYPPVLNLETFIHHNSIMLRNQNLLVSHCELDIICRDLLARLIRLSHEEFDSPSVAETVHIDSGDVDSEAATVQINSKEVGSEAAPVQINSEVEEDYVAEPVQILSAGTDSVAAPVQIYSEEVGSEAAPVQINSEEEDSVAEPVQIPSEEIYTTEILDREDCDTDKVDRTVITTFFQRLAETLRSEAGETDSDCTDLESEERIIMLESHLKKITEALSYLVGDAEAGVETAIRCGKKAFEEKAFNAVEEARNAAMVKTILLEKMAGLRAYWLEVFSDELVSEDNGIEPQGVYGPALAADLILQSIDELLSELTKSGCYAFERRDFSSVQEHTTRAQKFWMFRQMAERSLSEYRESKREEARLLVAR